MKTKNKILLFVGFAAPALWILIGILLFPAKGCIESNFLLNDESRLPKFILLPNGITRNDVTVSLFLYTAGDARFVVRGPAPERKILLNIVAKADWHETTLMEEKRRGTYDFSPHYYKVVFNGVDDIIKFPCKGPVYWMSDNTNDSIISPEPECPPVNWELIGRPS
jgi:hypothetical protein